MDKHGCDNNTDPQDVIRGSDSQPSSTSETDTIEILPFGVHWLRGSVPSGMLGAVLGYLEMWFGDYESRAFGLWFYDRSDAWPNGVSVNYHSTPERETITDGRIAVEIPGSALDPFDLLIVQRFMQGLNQYQWQASRIDVFFDDFDRIITPRKLFATVYEPGLFAEAPLKADFSGFLRIQSKSEHHKTRGIVHDEVDFGRRGSQGSGKYLRFYDKQLETQGRLKCCRWELELCDKKAKRAWGAIVRVSSEHSDVGEVERGIASVIGAMIGGSIDFKYRTGDANLDRLERYEFWQTIIDKMGRDPSLLRVPREEKKVHKSLRYICKQCSGTLQMLHAAMGAAEFLPMLVDIVTSEDRLTIEHRNAIAEYQNAVAPDPLLNIADLRNFCDEQGIELEGESDGMPEL